MKTKTKGMRTLETALTDALKQVPKRNLLPVCTFLHLSPDGFRATDMETFWHFPADVPINGSILLPVDCLKLAKGETLESIDILPEFRAILKTNRRTATVQGDNPADFPATPNVTTETEFRLNEGIMDAIRDVAPFVDTPKGHDYDRLKSVYWGMIEGVPTICATDAHALKAYNVSESNCPERAYIPPKVIKQLATGKFRVRDQWANLKTDGMEVTWKMPDEKYPNVWAVIPEGNPNSLQVFTADLIRAVDAVKGSANKTSHKVSLTLSPEGCSIKAEDLDFQTESMATFPAVYTGEPMEIGFNHVLLTRCLTGDAVNITMSTPGRAALIDGGDGSKTLCMPVMPTNY